MCTTKNNTLRRASERVGVLRGGAERVVGARGGEQFVFGTKPVFWGETLFPSAAAVESPSGLHRTLPPRRAVQSYPGEPAALPLDAEMSSTSSSFHFSPTAASPQHLPVSPLEASPPAVALLSSSPVLASAVAPRVDLLPADAVAPPLAPLTSRPAPTVRALSFAAPNQPAALASDDAANAGRRVSYAGPGYGPPALDAHKDDIWGLAGGRTIRADSDGAVLGVLAREKETRDHETRALTVEEETEEQAEEQRAAFRDHERRSLESIAGRLSSTNSFTQQTLLSPTSQSPPAASAAHITQLQAQAVQDAQLGTDPGRASASLHLGDLDVWMDEAYVRECCARMGWEGVTNIKMIRGAR